jgi:hypothetical protein
VRVDVADLASLGPRSILELGRIATGVLTHLVLIGSLGLRALGAISPEVLFGLNALNGRWALLLGRVRAPPGLAGDPA